jgi:hypothetical protein
MIPIDDIHEGFEMSKFGFPHARQAVAR